MARQRIVTTCRFYRPPESEAPIPDARWAYEKTSINGSRLMPHIVVGDPSQRDAFVDRSQHIPQLTEEYLGVSFWDGDMPIEPDTDLRIEMDLLYYPNVDYRRVQVGESFTIRFGPRIVGFGKILERFETDEEITKAEPQR